MTTAPDAPVGFIGLGRMGQGMARRLLASGVTVMGYDPDSAALASFVQAGGTAAGSVREIADAAGVVFASLPTIAISAEVALGEQGIVAGKAVHTLVETSTIGQPEAARIAATLLEKRGIHFIDAPVSGGTQGAADGTLTTVVAGDHAAFLRIETLLRAMASHIVYAGARPGLGQLFKVVNNYIVMSALATTCEAIAMGVRGGADEAQLVEVINHATGRNFATSVYFPSVVLPRARVPSLHMAMKDVQLFAEFAAGQGHVSSGAAAVLETWQAAAAQGLNMVDWYASMLAASPPAQA